MKNTTKRISLITGIAAAGLMIAPAVASAETPDETVDETLAACQISDATLEWGTIEAWRSYISGSIANGGWELAGDDVAYELPNFVWASGEGLVALDGHPGEIEFTGEVEFSGHDDLLQVAIANPVLEIVDAETAYLLLDTRSTDMEGNEDTSATRERAVEFDIAGATTVDGQQLEIVTNSGELTHEGAAAFGGFYEGGKEVDQLRLTGTIQDSCRIETVVSEQGASETDTVEEPLVAESGSADEPETEAGIFTGTLPWIIAGAALIVIVINIVVLAKGRRKKDDPAA